MDQQVREAVARFRAALEAFGISVARLIVYGSQAVGNAQEQSDIDVAVVSNYFEQMNTVQRLEAIGRASARARLTDAIEALAYTVAEYESMGPGTFIGQEVKPKGIEIV